MKNQFIFSCLMMACSLNTFSQVHPQAEPPRIYPIESLSQEEPFAIAIKDPYVWEPRERVAFQSVLESPRFVNAIAEPFSLSNPDQLRALKDMLDAMPTTRAMHNPMYDQVNTERSPCLDGNFNNPALRPDQLAINYKTSGRFYKIGAPIPYAFSIAIGRACNTTSEYAMVVDEISQVGFGTEAPQSHYHFAVPSFQIGDATKLQFKISGTVGSESMTFSRAGYDLFKVNKDGKVFAREVEITIAQSKFPDYVFTPKYQLRTLNEVDQYIQANHHLPGIEPAPTYEKEGTVNMGELQLKLLEKVEELTLYAIQQQKEIEKLKAQVATQK